MPERTPVTAFLDAQLTGTSPSTVVVGTVAACITAAKVYELARDGAFVRRSVEGAMAGARKVLRPLIEKEVTKAAEGIKFPSTEGARRFKLLPEKGLSAKEVRQASTALHEQLDGKMDKELLSGVVYAGTTGDTELVGDVIKTHLWANPLFADYFGASRRMEAEVVDMMVALFHGDAAAGNCGCYTFGGTESILMALLAYRNKALAEGIARPNIIIGTTAHPAFDKAAEYFAIRLIKVKPDPATQALCPREVEKHITSETVAIAGSAPQFAHGTLDPIGPLAALAQRRGIGMHVDACLGGMLIQFMAEAGFAQPVIDFRLPGVTSISCDIHKWGGSPKGASVVMYRDVALRRYQTFANADYPGGLYVTATVNGSKAGYVIAAAWATLIRSGRGQFVANCKALGTAHESFRHFVASKAPLLRIVGSPDIANVAFTSDVIDIYQFMTRMKARGFRFSPTQFPASVHLALTLEHTQPGKLDALFREMSAVLEEMAASADPATKSKQKHDAMIYGSTQAIPLRSVVCDVLRRYVDQYYTADQDGEA